MLKLEKEVFEKLLTDEESVIKDLEKSFQRALQDIETKIKILQADEMTQSRIYQIQYQRALKAQIEGIVEKLHGDNFTSIQQYLNECYTSAFVGTMYALHGQGMPVLAPIDQDAAVRAVMTDSKINEGLYEALGVDAKALKKSIQREISVGLSSGATYAEITRNISFATGAPLSRAKTIVRTEGHRVQQASSADARDAAKAQGCSVVKQWDSTLDGKTRDTHRELDGQIRETDKPFESSSGRKARYPGDFGDPAEDCNCRCVALTRATWDLDADELKTLKDRAAFFGLDKTSSFKDFEKKYLKAAQTVDKSGKSGIIGNRGSDDSHRPISQTYVDAINAGGKVKAIGNVNCAVMEEEYKFQDGTSSGVRKTATATIYITPDGTRFVYPKRYNKKVQGLSPDDAIATWYRVPGNIRAKIQKVVEIVDYYNPQDAYWRKQYKNFSHSYATGGNIITIYRAKNHDLNYLAETYCHEGGHYIDYTLPGTSINNRYCKQQEWQNAMSKDLDTSGKKSWRAYGENSPLEDFADSVAYYTFAHDQFAAQFPERAKLLDAILK